MNPHELARDLKMPDHDVWLLVAQLVRVGGWDAVFTDRMNLTEPAEAAVRDFVTGLTGALADRPATTPSDRRRAAERPAP